MQFLDPIIVLFQVLYRCKRSSDEIRVIRHNSHLLKRMDIVVYTLGRIVRNKYKLSSVVFDILQKTLRTTD